MSSVSFLILVAWAFSLFFRMILPRLIFLKNQFELCCFFSFSVLFSISLTFALVFIISVLLLYLGLIFHSFSNFFIWVFRSLVFSLILIFFNKLWRLWVLPLACNCSLCVLICSTFIFIQFQIFSNLFLISFLLWIESLRSILFNFQVLGEISIYLCCEFLT